MLSMVACSSKCFVLVLRLVAFLLVGYLKLAVLQPAFEIDTGSCLSGNFWCISSSPALNRMVKLSRIFALVLRTVSWMAS